jgi:hypothetical protein
MVVRHLKLLDGTSMVDAKDASGLLGEREPSWPRLGARRANIIAALWPERCRAMVSVNG